jgi:sec-independent protein translocase protein TatA
LRRVTFGRYSTGAYDLKGQQDQEDAMNLAIPFANGVGGPEIIILILVVMLLFGGKKLPELARGSGRALKIFKDETKGLMTDKDESPPTAATQTELPPAAGSTPTPPPATPPQEPVVKDLQNPDNSR